MVEPRDLGAKEAERSSAVPVVQAQQLPPVTLASLGKCDCAELTVIQHGVCPLVSVQ